MTDTILLEGMRFYGYHGVNPEEKTTGQRFVVDLAITGDFSRASQTDDVRDTVNYSEAFATVKRIVENDRFNLLEALAGAIANAVLGDQPLAQSVEVTVHKPGVAIKGSILDA